MGGSMFQKHEKQIFSTNIQLKTSSQYACPNNLLISWITSDCIKLNSEVFCFALRYSLLGRSLLIPCLSSFNANFSTRKPIIDWKFHKKQ